MSFVDDWDEHSIIYSAGIDDGMRGESEQQHTQVLPPAVPLTQVASHSAAHEGRFFCENYVQMLRYLFLTRLFCSRTYFQ
jgi:hypothetical protein